MQGSTSFALESTQESAKFDDDGQIKRTGTWMTASAHIITAVIGSGVLSLAWALAQLGWIAGPFALMTFSLITWFSSLLLADCYRGPVSLSIRNYTYMHAVKSHLGGINVGLCGLAQLTNLVGTTIGYTITTAISMSAIKRSNCFHKHGHEAGCHTSNNTFMIIFAVVQIILCQIPNFHQLSILSVIAAVMSFAYSGIGLALGIAKLAGGGLGKTSLTGVPIGENGVTNAQKIWNASQALGNIAFAYSYAVVLVEIQDTLKSSPPEAVAMKKATTAGIFVTTVFYMLCGVIGYAAFGNNAPGNFLTGFGFYEPFWLIDLANMCIVVHLVGAYQVFGQPIFGYVESRCRRQWPGSEFIAKEYPIATCGGGTMSFNLFRLVWRTTYVIFTIVIAMLLPFFNDFLGLLGAASFWPLTVYFPIAMYISRAKIRRFSFTWIWMQLLSLVCALVSLVAAAGSISGLVKSAQKYEPFKSVS
ncbi:amino acid permease 6-like [Diospyros lotus]|uniref:amino acid permease 6-like n=1 Tax=Diospyros lotus TaxID=55363 RepID=UPI0022591ACA|nr:amino acid permease 6-like [Diospyros lotus]